MNRRTAIRSVVIISAGAGILPSCLHRDKKPSIALRNISVSASDEDMLAELAESIIPKTTSFIGARDLRTQEFILLMVDDCTSPEDQKLFSGGLKSFEDACEKKWNHSFIKCSPSERREWLQAVEKRQGIPEDALKFYEMVKGLTVQNFTTSKEYLEGIKKYKMAPGPIFKGCVPV